MSRTVRTKRPQFYKTAKGTVRDGEPQHMAASCEHRGGCPYCVRTRTHANRRRAPVVE